MGLLQSKSGSLHDRPTLFKAASKTSASALLPVPGGTVLNPGSARQIEFVHKPFAAGSGREDAGSVWCVALWGLLISTSAIPSSSSAIETMNSSHPEGSDTTMMKWYEFNVECMTIKGIKPPEVSGDINNKVFFEEKKQRSNIAVEEGAEACSVCKSKKTVSVDVQKRSADEGMTTVFECSNCHHIWQV